MEDTEDSCVPADCQILHDDFKQASSFPFLALPLYLPIDGVASSSMFFPT